jgi:hypothetical protein
MDDLHVSDVDHLARDTDENAFSKFCAQHEASVRAILQHDLPTQLPEGFAHELRTKVLRRIWRRNGENVEPFTRRTARIATLLLRYRDGLLAIEMLAKELDSELRRSFENEFNSVPFSWHDVQPKFIDKLKRSTPAPERAAEFGAYARKILVNLVTDELRIRKKEVLEADLSVNGDLTRAIEDLTVTSLTPDLPETASTKSALRVLKLSVMQIPFRCPPNPPHQSLVWGYKELLGKGPLTLIREGLAGVPLRSLLRDFLNKVPEGKLSKDRWAQVTSPVLKVMDLQVGAVLKDSKMRKAYERMLSRICGDTCLFDYTASDGGDLQDSASRRQLEEKLIGNMSNWIEVVHGRLYRGVTETVYSA